MENLKTGDIIYTKNSKDFVVARVDGIVFIYSLNDDGSTGQARHYMIDDLISWGYKKENG